MKLLFSAVCMIFIISLTSAAHGDTDTLNIESHGYTINLNIENNAAFGSIANNDHSLTFDDKKVITKNDKNFIFFDDVRILFKQVNEKNYLFLIKIKSDEFKTRLSFVSPFDKINDKPVIKNTSQRNLFDEMNNNNNPTIKEPSNFKELILSEKQKKIDKVEKLHQKNIDNLIDSKKKSISILEEYEKSKIITGMSFVEKQKVVKEKVEKIDNRILHVLINNLERVNISDSFRFSVKVFDKNVYSGNDWDQFNGKMDDVSITAKIKDIDGVIKKEFSGKTKYGIFDEQVKVKENIWTVGKYTLEINVVFESQKINKLVSFNVLPISSNSFNNPPIANAGTGGHFRSGTSVTLDGSKSNDSDDTILFYTWTQSNGPKVDMDNKVVKPTFTIPDVSDIFDFKLVVSDGRKLSTNLANVTVSSIHADAGKNQTFVNNQDGFILNSTAVTLDGSASADSLKHKLNYLWEIISVPKTNTLSNLNIINNTNSISKFIPDVLGNYEFGLKIVDGKINYFDIIGIIVK